MWATMFKRNIEVTDVEPGAYLGNKQSSSIFLSPVLETDILDIIKSLDSKKSAGYDGITPDVIKKTAPSIIKPLTHIVNQSLLLGLFPDRLKIAQVLPIHKKGDSHSVSNYHPISLLSIFSKILEKVMYSMVYKYLSKCSILNIHQYGFRRNHSTSHAIIELVNKVLKAFEGNELTIATYMDLSKAFDVIDHCILLEKLEHYGVRGVAYEWFKSYLSSRKQFVIINNSESTLLSVTTGVPQGSVLGPLLFLLYVNDICNCSNIADIISFADDTTVIVCGKDMSDLSNVMNAELEKISKWFKTNKLCINVDKTNYMVFRPYQRYINLDPIVIRINNIPLIRKENASFLGIVINENLSWKNHTKHVSSKISKAVGIISKVKHIFPKCVLVNIYNSLILPYLQYGNVVWGNYYKSNIEILHKLQKRACRIITSSHRRQSSQPIFSHLKLLNIYDINKMNVGSLMHNVTANKVPVPIHGMFSNSKAASMPYDLRYIPICDVPFTRLASSHRSIFRQGPDFWNCLNNNIRDIPSLKLFKYRLKHYLLSKYV